MAEPNEVFAGVRVVELAQYVFVPAAGVLLADQGAEVIKIETIDGDPYRTLKVGDGREIGAINLAMEQNNRGKRSIALDLKSEEGREALLKLIETADVFLTSLRPKALRGLRLDVDNLRARNPKIIYARGNGLGFRGDDADRPGYDASAFWARGGACWAFTRPGEQPTSPRPAFGDHIGAVAIAFGVASALFRRAMTGEPTVVENSLLSTSAWALSSDITYAQVPGYSVHGQGVTRAPLRYGYRTRDARIIQFMLLNPQPYWASLCQMVGLEALIDDPCFADNEARMSNNDALIDLLQAKIGSRDWQDWKPHFDKWDAPWELIQTIDDVVNDPQVAANGMVYCAPVGDQSVRLVAGPVGFDGRAGPLQNVPAPELGADTDVLMAELGYSADMIATYRQNGIAR